MSFAMEEMKVIHLTERTEGRLEGHVQRETGMIGVCATGLHKASLSGDKDAAKYFVGIIAQNLIMACTRLDIDLVDCLAKANDQFN